MGLGIEVISRRGEAHLFYFRIALIKAVPLDR
ncbi:hypothetical protein SAMN04488121_1021086 [Chitinophaga filiformis]|uniref:Uncharacterized protein n=1 Tax=Chitinophaga filiformis TaxID=104663 RepID=A0A1G7P6U0_CHIFI|nr:hypothetical protein SAMN04488121_1021086 [Chitinophaga filiformis]